MSRRSLVTGGGGFIGRHLVTLLRDRGETVRVLDIADIPDPPEGVEVIRGSILDEARVAGALKGMDRLYHVAANPNLWAADPSGFLETNHRGTEIVLAAAARADLERIVHTSTESILKSYRRPNPEMVDETVAWTVDDMPGPYCRSKFLAEQAALRAAAGGLPVVIVNPTMPIGPGDLNQTPPTRMLLGFLTGKTPAFLECRFNLVDARDVAQGHVLAADKGRIGERYILGGTNLRMSELLSELASLTGIAMPRRRLPYPVALGFAVLSETWANITKKPPVAPITGVRLAHTPMLFSSSKAIAALGLPQTPLRTTLTDAIDWYRQRGWLSQGH
jgi:dihydroflavonol-4-reductase